MALIKAEIFARGEAGPLLKMYFAIESCLHAVHLQVNRGDPIGWDICFNSDEIRINLNGIEHGAS